MDAHQTSIYDAILICATIIGVIIIYFIVSIIHQHRNNRALYKRSLEAEIKTLENERARIASDLHDDLGPLLSSIKYSVGSLDIFSDTDLKTVDRVYEHIDSLMKRMREISGDMMPNTLLRKGLLAAVAEFIDNIPRPDSMEIKFVRGELPGLPPSHSIHLFRIIQEIMHNTIKHAKASLLKIEIKQSGTILVLLTNDNGSGFDYTLQARESTGLGLRNLFSRTEMLGGNMFVESARGKGTSYIIEIPIRSDYE
ncbi:MAG: ATP-binding protein [Bacteroidota bacterium]